MLSTWRVATRPRRDVWHNAKRVAARRPRSWSELLEQLYADSWNGELGRFRSPYAFRGLSAIEHGLDSSLSRLVSGPRAATLELSLLRNFRKYAHDFTSPGLDSIWHWLALGQHHGLPTRLVDWTYSPLVALHFATERPADYGRDGVVWCVNFVEANTRLPRRLRLMLEAEHSQTLTVDMLSRFDTLKAFDALGREPFVVFVEPPSVDVRMLNQFALFSLMPRPKAQLGSWLQAHPELCRRITVPAELKWEVRDKLDQANVNERTLFPGLDGLSRWLGRYYLLRVEPDGFTPEPLDAVETPAPTEVVDVPRRGVARRKSPQRESPQRESPQRSSRQQRSRRR